ncbi:MAG: hypothetical protein QXT26_05155, partial [Thermoproteota archaeon]
LLYINILTLMSTSRISVIIIAEELGEAHGVLIRIFSPRTVDAIVRLLPLEGRAAPMAEQNIF